MGETYPDKVCYADDAVLIAETEDDLLLLLPIKKPIA